MCFPLYILLLICWFLCVFSIIDSFVNWLVPMCVFHYRLFCELVGSYLCFPSYIILLICWFLCVFSSIHSFVNWLVPISVFHYRFFYELVGSYVCFPLYILLLLDGSHVRLPSYILLSIGWFLSVFYSIHSFVNWLVPMCIFHYTFFC